MDKIFWENYYNKSKLADYPSPFAEYCVNAGLVKNAVIVDIGCGNGRDSFYFINNSAKEVIGIDQSEVAIANNLKKINKLKKTLQKNINFYSGDFVKPESYQNFNATLFYSRFTFHAISHSEQSIFLSMLSEIMNSGDMAAIEARTINDYKYQKGIKTNKNTNFTDHHRCFSNPTEIIQTLFYNNFELIYFEESDKFAVFNDEKPCVMRLIFKKS